MYTLPWPCWLSWLVCRPVNRKVAISMVGQGTYLGCGFDPPLGKYRKGVHTQEVGRQLFSVFSVFLKAMKKYPWVRILKI